MRFYYWSFLNWIPITIFYVIAAGVLWILWRLIKDDKNAKYLIWALIPVMAILPWTEELWIAWRFGQLCKKDAGIFIYKTVEVNGFYDESAGATRVLDPVPNQAAEYWDKLGYKFYEKSLVDTRGGPSRVVHYEKRNGVWRGEVLDEPTVRYRYKGLAAHAPVAHKIKKFEDVVVDQETGEVLGRYLNYRRGAPWYFVHLDSPTIECKETREDTREYGSVIYHAVLKPSK